MPRDYQLYLDDIKKSCEKILRYTKGLEFEEFRRDELVYDAIIWEIIQTKVPSLLNSIK